MNDSSYAGTEKYEIIKDYGTGFEPVAKNEFSVFIKEKREDFEDLYHKEISTRELARMVGIDYEMFRKILNKEKPTKKRDCIIAICVALKMTPVSSCSSC